MPLPRIATPTYELVLPSSNRKIKYRPFLVKEEKLLIIAMESEDQKQITNAIKTVIGNCILTRGTKVDKLSTFDIEYIFLNIEVLDLSQLEGPIIIPGLVITALSPSLIPLQTSFSDLFFEIA